MLKNRKNENYVPIALFLIKPFRSKYILLESHDSCNEASGGFRTTELFFCGKGPKGIDDIQEYYEVNTGQLF